MRIFFMLLLSAIASRTDAQAFTTPFFGQVTGLEGKPLALRVSAPDMRAGRYTRGPFVCAAFPGTTFYATESTQLVTGETWYWVQIARPATLTSPQATACSPNVTGWMVGQLKGGAAVVALTTPNATPPVGTAKPGAEQKEPKNFPPETKVANQLSPWVAYPLLILGTFLSVVVVTWERHRNVTRAALAKRLTIFEFVTLAITNSIALAVLAPAYQKVDANAWGAKMLQHLTGTAGGHFLVGFILTILAMKSVSFATPYTPINDDAAVGERLDR